MPTDKYLSIFPSHMEAFVYLKIIFSISYKNIRKVKIIEFQNTVVNFHEVVQSAK